jgi:hypothetical protein
LHSLILCASLAFAMSKTPTELLLDSATWKEVGPPVEQGELPYVTHEGTLEIGGYSLRCYRLSSGQAVFHADDFRRFFGIDE